MISDIERVQQVKRGEAGAFEALVRKYARLVYAKAILSTRDVHEAEDIVQETWVRVYEKIHSLREIEQFRAWMMRVAHNLCTDRARKKKPEPLSAEATLLEGRERTPDHRLFQIEVRDKILEAIAQLPERAQEPMLLRYLEGFSPARIREVTGLEEGVLKGLLTRGLATLRIRLQPLYDEIHSPGGVHDVL